MHIRNISKSTRPAPARSLLEWSQIGTVLVTFTTVAGNLITALGNYINIGPDDDWSKTA